jgi:outer membrane receptor protein involved in Fe transport
MTLRRNLGSSLIIGLLLDCNAGTEAQEPATTAAMVGRPISAIIDELRRGGLPFAYSTSVLRPELTVVREPESEDPLELVREILEPHGLTLRWSAGLYLVIRADPPQAATTTGSAILTVRDAATGAMLAAPSSENPSTGLSVERLADGRLLLSGEAERRYGITLAAPGFEPVRHSLSLSAHRSDVTVALSPFAAQQDLVVTASRYEILRELVSSPLFIDQRTLQQQPDLGDDPLRALHRLPGTAAGGASAKAHIRGGEEDETAIVLNGQRLLDPFHIRDYQSLFSAIDTRAIEDIEVYTGSFPVRYGDRIGGLVLIDALSPDQPRHTEIGVSVLNTSVLSAGTIGEGTGDWLVSARRGNLDRVLTEELGEPSYYDFFGEIGVNFSPRNRVTVNALTAQDRVLLVTESDPTEREQSENDTRNTHLWVHWEQEWSNDLSSSTGFMTSRFASRRVGSIADPEKIVASVDDRRDVAIDGLRQDWSLPLGDRHVLSWGGEYERLAADYEYWGSADYYGFYTTFVGVPTQIRRRSDAHADGELFGVYFSDRWDFSSATSAELGWRWDKQGYTDTPNERQFSPRFSLLHEIKSGTDLRVSLGRYYQAQGIHELQVEDGVAEFYTAQRSDQAVIGVQHAFADRYSMRIEAYWKSLRQLRPRYENLFDPLALIPELEPDRVRVAPQRGSARGLELSLAYSGMRELSWWASYVLARVEDRVEGADVPRSWDQRHAVQVGVAWNGPRWDLGAALNVHTGWATTGLTLDQADPAHPIAVPGERNALRFDDFASLDLRASRSVPLRVGSLEVFLEVSNATNRENPCCGEFDLEEDDAGGMFLEQDTDNWLPRLASFGLLWKF